MAEVLCSLDRLCLQQQEIGGIAVSRLPVPNATQAQYLAALTVTLPKMLVQAKAPRM